MGSVIELNNLSKYYGKKCGIRDVTFSVGEGEMFGFIGPNGAGKSTTIRTMLSLIRKSGGSAKIFDLDCHNHRTEILQSVGYLPSEVFYYDRMKAGDLLRYSATFYDKDCKDKIEFLCDALSLDQKEYIENMSFGNRKKVGIAQCLLHSPKLIILDEPTSGLDPLMQKTFFELLAEEIKQGATVLLSSHVLGEVQRSCDRVAIIKEGRIVSIEDLNKLTASFYKKVHIITKQSLPTDFKPVDSVDVERGENSITFMYRGDGSKLVHNISALDIADLVVQEPTLEEVFMNYYEFGEAPMLDTQLFQEESLYDSIIETLRDVPYTIMSFLKPKREIKEIYFENDEEVQLESGYISEPQEEAKDIVEDEEPTEIASESEEEPVQEPQVQEETKVQGPEIEPESEMKSEENVSEPEEESKPEKVLMSEEESKPEEEEKPKPKKKTKSSKPTSKDAKTPKKKKTVGFAVAVEPDVDPIEKVSAEPADNADVDLIEEDTIKQTDTADDSIASDEKKG